jgi:hypothetical protein
MSRDSLFFERGAGYNECRLETIDLIPPDSHSKNADCQVANLAAVEPSRTVWSMCVGCAGRRFRSELILSIRQGLTQMRAAVTG